MRLADYYSINEEGSSSKAILTQLIKELTYNPPEPSNCIPDQFFLDDLRNYYENYYLLTGQVFKLLDIDNGEKIEISEIEDKIIDFCVSPNSETRIQIFHGHTGVGKSSLMTRIFFYIYPQSKDLKSKFFPLFINHWDVLIDLDINEKLAELKTIIADSFQNKVWNLLQENLESLIVENKKSNPFVPFNLTTQDLNEAADNLGIWLDNKFKDNTKSKVEFRLKLIKYFRHTKRANFIIIFDNIDNYGSKMHNDVFAILDNLLPDLEISAISSMRTSTYRSIIAGPTQKLDDEVELRINDDFIAGILTKRMMAIKNSTPLHPDIPMRVPGIDANDIDYLQLFSDFMLDKTSRKTLILLSNSSVKSLFEKFKLISDSPELDDKFVFVHLLKQQVDNEYINPTWVFYRLLFGGVVTKNSINVRSKKMGIINIFNGSKNKDEKWRFFIQLILLMDFYKWNEFSSGRETYISNKEIQSDVHKVFGDLISPGLYYSSLYSLISSELIFAESSGRYTDEDYIERIRKDKFIISMAGQYYLTDLIHVIEYFNYMKDDINWPFSKLPSQVQSAKRRISKEDYFISVVKCLHELTKLELECLSELKMYWAADIDLDEKLKYYRLHFSPFNTIGDTLLFTETIAQSFLNHIKYSLQEKYEGSRIEKEFNNLATTISSSKEVIDEYLNA